MAAPPPPPGSTPSTGLPSSPGQSTNPPATSSKPTSSPQTSPTTTPSQTPPPPPTDTNTTPPGSTNGSSTGASSSSSTPPSSATPTSTPTPSTTSTPPPVVTTTPPTTTRSSTHSQGVVTQLSTSFVTGTIGPTANADHKTSSKGFFDNTGAVAGVFSVVGLIGLAILIALITNGIRRRRARKFDKELAAATLEAASAPKPVFLDDDDDMEHGGYGSNSAGGYGSGAAGGGGYGAFSDASSHGTYSQTPMGVGSGAESYGMRELQHHAPVQPGELFDPYATAAIGAGAAGAAGIGVARARSHRALQGDAAGPGGSYGAGLQEGGAPYAAFAAPSHQSPPPIPGVQEYGGRNPNLDVMEAAGLGAHVAGAGALARNKSASVSPASTPAGAHDPYALERNKSLGSYDAYAAPYAQQQGIHQQQSAQQASGQQQQQSYYNSAVSNAQAQMYGGGYTQAYQTQSQQSSYQQQSSSYQQQSSYQHHQQSQQQQGHQRGYSDVGVDDDDAYGGYVVEDEPPSSHHVVSAANNNNGNLKTPGTTPGSDSLPNPFERPVASSHGHGQGHGGYAEYDERDRASSDDGDTDAEPPRRVLKVANE